MYEFNARALAWVSVVLPVECSDALAPLVVDLARALRGQLEPRRVIPTDAVQGAMDGDSDYNRLWQAIGHDPPGMDDLVVRTGLTAATLSSMLLALELDGRIAAEHGRYAGFGA